MQKCPCIGSFLDKFIQPSILLIVNEKPAHGFSILKSLAASEYMDYGALDPTGLYRTLKKMESAGLLSSSIDRSGIIQCKRVYGITEEGRACLASWKVTLSGYAARIKKLADAIPGVYEEENI